MATLEQALDQMYRDGMPPMPSGHPRLNTDRIVRYGPKLRAWYRLYEHVARNGRSYVSGAFGYWGLLPEGGIKIESRIEGLDREELERFKQAQAEAEQREREKRETRAQNAASRAAMQWRQSKIEGGPFTPALVRDAYNAYRVWCMRTGERFPVTETRFSHQWGAMPGVTRKRAYRLPYPDDPSDWSRSSSQWKQYSVFVMGQRPEGEGEELWTKKSVGPWRKAAQEYVQFGRSSSSADDEAAAEAERSVREAAARRDRDDPAIRD